MLTDFQFASQTAFFSSVDVTEHILTSRKTLNMKEKRKAGGLCSCGLESTHAGPLPRRALIQGWLKCQCWNECYNWYNPWNIISGWPWLRWYNLSLITDDCSTLIGNEGAQIGFKFQMSKKWDACEVCQESRSSVKMGSRLLLCELTRRLRQSF